VSARIYGMPTAIYIILFVFGLIFGSFFNVLIYRLPRDKSIISPPSSCPKCGARIRWYDNIPLISWALLGAKCRACGQKISVRYPLVELAGGLIFAGVPLLGHLGGYSRVLPEQVTVWHDLISIAVISLVFLILVIDFEHQIIPDQLSVGMFAVGWLGVFVLHPGISPSWASSLIGMFILSLFFLIFALAIGGFGMGDVKLAVGMGALFGWQLVSVAAMLSFFIGGIIAIFYALYLLSKKKLHRRIPIPFGPYLALATIITLFWGQRLLDWYLGLFGLK
jgi:leader peptidase (prepilin peptidase)/N-methyltransferase